jgi:hypothetical protein
MTEPTTEQLLHLVDRAADGRLLPDEAALLRTEIEQLLTELDGRDEEARERWITKQLDETGIRSMDFRNGIDMELAPARDMVAQWVGAARAMLGDAENYTETPIEMTVKVAEEPERYAFVLQRVGKLTPHQARQAAEERAEHAESQHSEACQTIAAMHAAAIGHTGDGPARGVVEDVEDIRLRVEQAQAAVARVRALHHPVEHRGQIICAECSAYDGTSSTDNPPAPWPCPTNGALGRPAPAGTEETNSPMSARTRATEATQE